MTNGIVTQHHVVAVGDYRVIPLANGERDEVVGLPLQRSCRIARHGRYHSFQVALGDGDFSRTRVADAIGGLRDRGLPHDFRGGAG